MRRIVLQNKQQGNKGVTLVEVLISLVILLLVFMGLIQASLLSIQSNMRNVLRDEAVRITADRMARLRSVAFNDVLVDDTGDAVTFKPDTPSTVTRNVRNIAFNFTLDKIVDNLDADHKQITVRTSWQWQGESLSHSIANTRGR